MSDAATTSEKNEQKFEKVSESKHKTYAEAKVEFDAVKTHHPKVRLRKREDGYGVVLYRALSYR